MRFEEKVIHELIKRGKTLCTAESCTGGSLANRLTDVPDSSKAFLLGLITYSNDAKIKLLRVPESLLRQRGAVSDEVAMHMAQAVRKKSNADFGIGISGIAGPGGGTRSKPVGLCFIAVSTKKETLCLKCLFPGTRTKVKKQAADQALKLLWEFLV